MTPSPTSVARSDGTPQKRSEAARGDRLNPLKSSRIYWHLTCLRREIETIIGTFLDGKSISRLIDFGCGNMPYRPLLEPHVEEYVGVDFSGNELADQEFDPSGNLPMASGSVDVVLSSQVLEHVVDPTSYLSEAHRVLVPDGCLILSTHGVWKYHPDPTDFWRWTCDGLRKQIEAAGFEIVRFHGVMGPAATALQLWQDAVLWKVPHRLSRLFTRFMQFLIRRADLRCFDGNRDRDACVYVVFAKKKG